MQNMDTLVITTLSLSLLVIALGVITFVLHNRVTKLTKGKKGSSLESTIIDNHDCIQKTQIMLDSHSAEISAIKQESMNNLQNIGVVRFNPFKEMGGSQSFAVAITDKNNNGVVISSLYARDRVNIFAKPLTKGISEYTLTEEEQQAITQSIQ